MIFRTMAKCSNTRKKTVNNFVRQSNYGERLNIDDNAAKRF